ncbi:MAG: hypothetical protein EA401_04210 [Planctomycetota bacterium]|nr:MAG: hypothetical protein EA401_04210 [Planctomycetota bacterium]
MLLMPAASQDLAVADQAVSGQVIVEARDEDGGVQLRYQAPGEQHPAPRGNRLSDSDDGLDVRRQGNAGGQSVSGSPQADNPRTQALLSEQERRRRQEQPMPIDPQQEERVRRRTAAGDNGGSEAEEAASPNVVDSRPWSVELFDWGPALTVRDGILGFGLDQKHFPNGVAEVANVSGGVYRMQFEGDPSAILVDGQPLDPDHPQVILDGDGRTITFAEPVGVVLTPVDDWEADDIEAPADSG